MKARDKLKHYAWGMGEGEVDHFQERPPIFDLTRKKRCVGGGDVG